MMKKNNKNITIKQKFVKYSKRFLKVIAIATGVYLLMLFLGQKAIIYPGAYFDNPRLPENSVLQLKKIELAADDGNPIVLYKLASQENNKKALLIFHGNADTAPNIINRLYNPYVLYYGYDIYALEYRGFNGVQGSPSEEKILADSKIAVNFINKEQEYDILVYYGHSLGTGIAVNLVKEAVPDALILEAPFSSLKDMASSLYPFIPKTLVNVMVKENYNSLETLKSIEIPNLLILNAQDDHVIPYTQGKTLYENAKSPNKIFKNYPKGGHSDIFLVNNISDLRDFLLNLK